MARTAFTTTLDQVDFLDEYGHIEHSGFARTEAATATGRVKLTQGVYTAIDDVVWQWGDYVERYSRHLVAVNSPVPEGVLATDANTRILLD